jgi:hypothetical protein
MLLSKRINPLNKVFLFLSVSFFLTVSIYAQDMKNEPQIMVTESGIEYEVVGWDVETIYDPTSYSWENWETPVYESVRTKKVYPVPMSKFDKPPVFTKACADAENAMTCTNEALQEFMKDKNLEYPADARNNRQEGLEYVTFVMTEKGEFEGRPTVLSKDKPCAACADRAVEIVKKTENLWQPAVLDGEPVKVRLTIPVRFDLKRLSQKF